MSGAAQPRHPLGVQPEGNLLLGEGPPCCREAGLGAFACLRDELLLDLLGRLPPHQLAALSTASRALYAFCAAEELWRAATLERWGGDVRFWGGWRPTFARRLRGRSAREDEEPLPLPARVDCSGVYSDLLWAPHLCATAPLAARWLGAPDTVPRADSLSLQDFVARFEEPNVPVVLTGWHPGWSGTEECAEWASRAEACAGDARVFAGGYGFSLRDYLAYAQRVRADDAPLYLFDREVLAAAPDLAAAPFARGSAPFLSGGGRDHFSLLPAEQRPDHTWLIVGPPRSGSQWHKDPNATSAWNVVLQGSKLWLLTPPSRPPPGIAASADGSQVAGPTSIVDWFLNFYDQAVKPGTGCLQCVCRPGDLLFVPSGWWHCALNIEPQVLTVAVTGNYCCDANLHKVLAHLATPPEQELVSGCRTDEARAALHSRLVAALERERPASLAAARARVSRKVTAAARFAEGAGPGGGFSFNFNGDGGA